METDAAHCHGSPDSLSPSSPNSVMLTSRISVLQQALTHIPNPNSEFMLRNVSSRLAQLLHDQVLIFTTLSLSRFMCGSSYIFICVNISMYLCNMYAVKLLYLTCFVNFFFNVQNTYTKVEPLFAFQKSINLK